MKKQAKKPALIVLEAVISSRVFPKTCGECRFWAAYSCILKPTLRCKRDKVSRGCPLCVQVMNEHRDCPYNYLVAQEGLRDHEDQCKLLIAKQYEFEDRFTRLSLDHDKYYDAYHELKDAAIALVQRLELDKDVKKNNWWLNERARIMEVIDDNKEL